MSFTPSGGLHSPCCISGQMLLGGNSHYVSSNCANLISFSVKYDLGDDLTDKRVR